MKAHEVTFQRTKEDALCLKRQERNLAQMLTNPRAMKTKLNKPTITGIGIACGTVVLAGLLIWNNRLAQAQPRPEPPLSGNSATGRIATNRYFPARLAWVGTTPPSQEESQLLWEVLEQWKASGGAVGLAELEEFVATLTNSAWAPSLRVNLGQHYRSRGQTTRALAHWEAAWDATKALLDRRGKHVADSALAHLTRLLVLLGRTDELTAIYQAHGNRVLDRGPLSQMWLRTQEKYLRMHKAPEDSYKCGIYALNRVGQALQLRYRRGELLKTPSKPAGFSLLELEEDFTCVWAGTIGGSTVTHQWARTLGHRHTAGWRSTRLHAERFDRSGHAVNI
jgi:hypothetical protein